MRAVRRRPDHETPRTEDHDALIWPAAASDDRGLSRATRELPATQKLAIERLKLGENRCARSPRKPGFPRDH